MDLDLCTGVQSCWNKNGPSPNYSHNVGGMKLSKMYWYAEELRVPFTGTKGPSPTPEKQLQTITPLNQTLHLAQYRKASTVLLATIGLLDRET